MATVDKSFRIKNGLIVEGSSATVNGSTVLTEASTEFLQDTVGAMVNGSTQTNITVTYDDATGKLNFVAENGVADSTTDNLVEGTTNKYFTDERAQDAVGNNLAAGLSYNDVAGTIGIDSTVTTNSGTQTLTNKTINASNNTLSNIPNSALTNSSITINGVSTALGASRTLGTDDVAEGSTNKYFTDERAQDAVAAAIAAGTHTNITITYDDNANSLSFTGAVTYTDENAQDAVGNAVGNGLDYDDNTGSISVDPSEFALSAVGAPTADVTMASYKITNLAAPTSANDAANKAYVDNVTAGLNFHAAVHAATTANLDATYNNGTSGVGATLTANANGALVVDGHTLSVSERVLVKNQSTGSQNGIYSVTATGDGSNPWVLTRATDADNSPSGEVAYGDFMFVQAGTANAGYGFILNTTGTVTIGTTSLSYVQFNAGQVVIAGNGLTEPTPGTLAIDTSVTANLSGTQTLTNKTIALGNNTVSGTLAQFNAAVTDADLASLTGTETLTNKTISGSSNTLTNIANSSLTNSSITVGTTNIALGGSSTSISGLTSLVFGSDPTNLGSGNGSMSYNGTNWLVVSTDLTTLVSGNIITISGSPNDPSYPTVDINQAWTITSVATSQGDPTAKEYYITALDTMFKNASVSGAFASSWGVFTIVGSTAASTVTISDTEIKYLDGITSNIQTQLNTKASLTGTETLTNKSLTTPLITGDTVNAPTISFNVSDALPAPVTGLLSFDPSLGFNTNGQSLTLAGGYFTTPQITIGDLVNGASIITLDQNWGVNFASGSPGIYNDIVAGGYFAKNKTGGTVSYNLSDENVALLANDEVTLTQFDVASFTSAKLFVQMSDGSGNKEITEVLVTVDGSNNVYITEYGNIITNMNLGSITATYSAAPVPGAPSVVVITATAAVNNVTFKFNGTLIAA